MTDVTRIVHDQDLQHNSLDLMIDDESEAMGLLITYYCCFLILIFFLYLGLSIPLSMLSSSGDTLSLVINNLNLEDEGTLQNLESVSRELSAIDKMLRFFS